MQLVRIASLAIACTLALGACATSGGNSGASGGPVSAAVAGTQWTGSLQPAGGSSVRGDARLAPGGSNMQSSINVSVSGSTSGAVHPWHLHRGSCANDMGIVGSPDAYPTLGIGADGTGRVMVGLPFALPTSGSHFVSVHQSPQDMTRIACGDLTMGSR
jgi:hypothetical protein